MANRAPYRIMYAIFFLSGISGLIYETVWLRVLSRIVGCTIYATSIVLSAFMLGLALGSYFIGRKADSIKRIIRAYAILEVLVGLTALVVFLALNDLTGVFKFLFQRLHENHGLFLLLQSIIVFFALVMPTLLMGGTLPILAAAIKKYKVDFAQSMGNLYGLNTLGAVLGVLLSGFITIGAIGEFNTVLIGVGINGFVGMTAWLLLDKKAAFPLHMATATGGIEIQEKISGLTMGARTVVLIAYAVLGFTSFAIEVVWTRIFQLQLGTSIYSFSLVLGIYLFGSAIGSLLSGRWHERLHNPVQILGYAVIFIGLYSMIGTFLFAHFTPQAAWQSLNAFKLVLPVLVIFPITFTLGAIFPIVSFCYVKNRNHIGDGIGFLYAMNTVGCIAGSLVAGFILIAAIGTRGTVIFISLTEAVLGAIVLAHSGAKRQNLAFASILIIATLGLGILSPDPFFSVIKKIVDRDPNMEIYYHKEGVAATTTAYGSKTEPLDKHILINGIGMTSLVPETKIMAHLPILLNKNTKEVLIICFGMGTVLKSAVAHGVHCEVVELVGEEYETYDYFHKEGRKILADERVNHFIDDGRNYLALRDKKYDVITIDPAPPIWSAGTVNLYTSDFFQLCRNHLNPGGVYCLWIPPESYTEIKMIIKTFFDIFPNTVVYQGPKFPGFYLIGTNGAPQIDRNRFKETAQNQAVMDDLNEWSTMSPEGLLDLKIAGPSELGEFVKDAGIITDNHPYTEFPLWRKMFDPLYKYKFNAKKLKKIIDKKLTVEK